MKESGIIGWVIEYLATVEGPIASRVLATVRAQLDEFQTFMFLHFLAQRPVEVDSVSPGTQELSTIGRPCLRLP